MLPYNTGKYHETPEGIPMLHAVDHSLTETMLSLSPSSQFMYEPEVMDSTMCGQSQGSAGPPNLLEINSGEDFIKSEGIISPTVEGMTFQDYPDPEALFSPPADGLVFNDCLQLSQALAVTAPGMMFEERVKQEDALYSSVKMLGLKGCERLQPAFVTSLGDMSFGGVGQKTGGGFDMLSDVINLEDRDKLNPLIPSTSEVGGMNVEGIGNDWFELDKDLYEMSKDTDILLQDPVFSRGPTLTQLNSKDLDSTCLDEYSILDDLYSKTFPLDHLQDVAPTTIVSKFPSGIPGVAVMSPKFTTCTVTSFVNSVTSAGGTNLPEYPAYIANELLVNQELCQLRNGGVPDSKPKLLPQSQWASIFAAKSGLASIPESSCYVPVLRNLSQVDDLIGAVVVAGGGAVSLVVTEQPVRPPLPPVVRDDSLKNNPDDNWEEIERFLLAEYGGKQPVVKNVNVNKNQTNVKVEPQAEATFAAHEEDLSDKESMLEDSDVENEDLDNSDEDESVGKSDNMDEFGTPSRKDKKYFWQYNTQSKGPKGKRLCKSVETNDPHVLHDFEDPVFDPEQNQTRYKHNGKARRGDGNDVTPNPHKLFVTGNELKKLNKLINGMMPSSEMPASARAKLLKEKNKYASRACRLKKKAQHEANKLKLHGLELEHRQLMKILVKIKKDVTARVCRRDDFAAESLSNKLESLISKHLTLNVAGRTADYVNSVLQQVAKGDRMGGICLDD